MCLATVMLLALCPAGNLWAQDDEDDWRLVSVLTLTNGVSFAQEGEYYYLHDDDDVHGVAGMSLRLQFLGQLSDWMDYRIDGLSVLVDGVDSLSSTALAGAARFRTQSLRWNLEQSQTSSGRTVLWYNEIDQAHTRMDFGDLRVTLGRQAITWGTGRFWQPTDVFLAFSATELERDFKQGIDAVQVELFTGDLSSLTFVYVLSPWDSDLDSSPAVRWQSQVGGESEATLVAGSVQGVTMLGGTFDSTVLDAGWRMEALAYRLPAGKRVEVDSMALFAMAGLDYFFPDGTSLLVEWHMHSMGATSEAELLQVAASYDVQRGRQPSLSRNILGLSASREFGGLWSGSYSAFLSALADAEGAARLSTLHQAAVNYSVSDNATLAFSILRGTGAGLDEFGLIHSEYGHLPTSILVQGQFYF